MFTEQQIRDLERRLLAAITDIALWAACCYALYDSFGNRPESPNLSVGLTTLTILAISAGIELFTGTTLGKWLTSLRVVRSTPRRSPPAEPHASAPPSRTNLLLRGMLRFLPVATLLLTAFSHSPNVRLIAIAASATIAACYLCTSYLTLVRFSCSIFDLAASTAVRRVDAASSTSPSH